MTDLARTLLLEPGVSDARHYARRVRVLAVVHVALFLVAIVGLALLVWRASMFVTLAQRSNVETLTIAFFLLFFGYFAVATFPGAVGAVRIAFHALGVPRDLGKPGPGPSAAFDKAVELEGRGGEPWELELRDAHGSLGRLRFDGVRVSHLDAPRGGSSSLLGFVERKLDEITGSELEVVQWGSTDKEGLLQYAALAHAMRATWPTVRITEAQRAALERDVRALCPALRDEAFLPDWEYQGEHKLPIIPEPLGIVSLSRNQRRVDPLSSMTAALVIVAGVVALLVLFVVRPPWVPGH